MANKTVFLAILAYTGYVDVATMGSVIDNIESLTNEGFNINLHFEVGCCYLPEARNNCVAKFLESRANYLCFIDSDLGFNPNSILKMVKFDKDIICGAYPFKTGVEGFPIKVLTNNDLTPCVEEATGLIKIEGGPTGLMIIKKEVFQTLINKNPEWKTNRKTEKGNNIYAIFDTGMLFENDRNWYGEDYLFCYRAINAGYNIFCYPDINFLHIGRNCRTGNYHQFLLKQPKPEAKL